MNEYSFNYLNYVTNIPNPNNNYGNNNMNNYNQILEPYQGLVRGNLFANLYDPYKNYKPNELKPTNEQTALLYQIMQYKFALTELNLYLDNNPYDNNALDLFYKYSNIEKQMCDKYESMYGPLTLNSPYLGKNSWEWKKSPWPWEVI